MNFVDIFNRIKSETDIKTLTRLAEFLETTQPYMSKKKKDNEFPANWAYKIAQQYNLSTDWIMTGEGAKNRGSQIQQVGIDDSYLSQVIYWFREITRKDPRKKTWFEIQFEKAFPEFVEWLRSREAEKEERKVA